MDIIAFDTETHLIAPGLQAPPLVCVQYSIFHGCTSSPVAPSLRHHSDERLFGQVCSWLTTKSMLIVGHNVAYDMSVLAAWRPELLPLIWQAYEEKRVTDTMIREQLLNNQKGWLKSRPGRGQDEWIKQKYSLGDLTRKYLGYALDKPGIILGQDGLQLPDPSHVRLRYSELVDNPNIDEWPEAFRVYALKDAEATMDVYLAQSDLDAEIPDEYVQAHGEFCLKLMSAWGMRTTLEGIVALEADTLIAHEECKRQLIEAGLIRPTGTRNIKAAQAWLTNVCQEMAIDVPRTKPSDSHPDGQPSLSSDTLEKLDDPILTAYAEFGVLNAVVSKDIPMLRAGVDKPIHCRYGFAMSGRTTCSKPNLQNLRTTVGIREAFSPREGKLFLATDYSGLELHTLAEVCFNLFGYSKLGEALNLGRDPHTEIACRILDVSYQRALEMKAEDCQENGKPFYRARQTGKAANFGFPGGLGLKTFILQARAAYGVILDQQEAAALKRHFFDAWPEVIEFFAWIDSQKSYTDGLIKIEQLGSNRIRGGMFFPAACNTMFQGLGADAAKAGLRKVSHACYVDRSSVLFNCRPVFFVHDEIGTEIPDGDGLEHERAEEHGRLMRLGANEYVPHYNTKVETVLMRKWSKNAKPIYDENKRLIVYG